MSVTRAFFVFILFLSAATVTVPAQTYRDDSVAVREILDVNGFESLTVEEVSTIAGTRIYGLYLNGKGLQVLPECLGNIDSLGNIQIQENHLTALPRSIGKLKNLRYLSAYDNNLSELPEELGGCKDLELLYLIRNQFTRWPAVLSQLTKLETIDLGGNHLTEIIADFSRYAGTDSLCLYINDNYLSTLPETFAAMKLKKVHVSGNLLCSLSTPLKTWLDTYDYHKENSQWQKYQECDSYYSDSSIVDQLLRENGWGSLSVGSVSKRTAQGIISIDVSAETREVAGGVLVKRKAGNPSVLVLPENIYRMRHLRSLDISGNRFDSLPGRLAELSHISALDLSGNTITILPEYLATFSMLTQLDISGNSIAEVSPRVGEWLVTRDPDWAQTQQKTLTKTNVQLRGTTAPLLLSAEGTPRYTELRVTFPLSGEVSVTIYSIGGRKLAAAASQRLTAGTHTIRIGEALRPGSYFAVFTTNGERNACRFTLLK